jgi:hypothetical protein
MVKVKLYVEGGGNNQEEQKRLKRGLGQFLSKAGLAGRMPVIHAKGPRHEAYRAFRIAMDNPEPNTVPVLLVDSEGPVHTAPWQHLKQRDDWDCPAGAKDDHAQLFVQVMETWLIADHDTLRGHYGSLNEDHLAKHPNPEDAPKDQVLHGLEMATRSTKKGPYRKSHAFDLLAKLNPDLVRKLPHANRLIETLKNMKEET